MDQPLIISDPKICLGKPTIAGTRMTVEFILESLGAGETVEQFLEAHPHLSHEAILAALAYAARALGSEETYPIGNTAA